MSAPPKKPDQPKTQTTTRRPLALWLILAALAAGATFAVSKGIASFLAAQQSKSRVALPVTARTLDSKGDTMGLPNKTTPKAGRNLPTLQTSGIDQAKKAEPRAREVIRVYPGGVLKTETGASIALEATQATETTPSGPALPVINTGARFVVMAGAFKNLDNAQKLFELVRSYNYPANLQEGTDLNRVTVGPYRNEATARSVAAQLYGLVR